MDISYQPTCTRFSSADFLTLPYDKESKINRRKKFSKIFKNFAQAFLVKNHQKNRKNAITHSKLSIPASPTGYTQLRFYSIEPWSGIGPRPQGEKFIAHAKVVIFKKKFSWQLIAMFYISFERARRADSNDVQIMTFLRSFEVKRSNQNFFFGIFSKFFAWPFKTHNLYINRKSFTS